MRGAVAFVVRNRRLVILLALFAAALAALEVKRVPVDVLPDLNDPRVVVLTEVTGLPAEEVEALVTVPIENALNSAPGLRRLASSSGGGLSIVNLDFDWGTDLLQARQVVAEKLATVREDLPRGAEAPVLGPITSRLGEVVEYVVRDPSGGRSLMNLREAADRVVRPRLLAVPGVTEVTHMGGDVPQFQVLVDSTRLLDFRLTLDQVAEAVERANLYSAGGFLTEGPREYQIQGLGRAYAVEHFEKAVVLPWGGVTLSDPGSDVPVTIESLAETTLGPALRRGAASHQGQEAVLGKVSKGPGINTLEVTERIQGVLRGLDLGGVEVEPIYLQRDLIERAVGAVLESLWLGTVLVAAVIALFLLRLRPTLIALTSIPLSLLFTIVALRWLGLGFNVMTLGGLAIAVGMVVDDSIIDVENTCRRLREHFLRPAPGVGSEEVTVGATLEIRNGVFFATAIVVLVFLPLLGLGGVGGRMFAPLGITVIVAMGCSLLVSLLVTPALCQALLDQPARAGQPDSLVIRLGRRVYEPVVRAALDLRLAVALTAVLVVAGALWLGSRLGREFLPAMDEGALVVNAHLSPGTSLPESFAIAQRIERRLLEVPGVRSVSTRTGRAERDEHAEGVYASEMLIGLAPMAERQRSIEEIRQAVRLKLREFPGVAASIGQPIGHRLEHLLAGVEAQLAVKIFGPDLEVLRAKAAEARDLIADLPGVADLFVEPQVEVPTLRIDLDRDDLAIYGFQAAEVVEFLETAFAGKVVGQVVSGPASYAVVVKLREAERSSVERVLELRMQSPRGEFVPLKELANVRRWKGPSAILREDLSRRIVVRLNAVGRDLGAVASQVEERLAARLKLPEGYSLAYGGEATSRVGAMARLRAELLLVLAGILALLYLALGSVRLALLVMLTIPLALAGGVLTLSLGAGVLSLSAAIGFLLVFGIATRNGILLVDHIHRLREEGLPLLAAVSRGAVERLSPVLMTALSTGLGMLPLALGRGAGAEIQRPLAAVIVGGTLTSTLLTLVVLPAAYALVEGAAEEMDRRRSG